MSCYFGGQPECREGCSTASQNIPLTNGFTILGLILLPKKENHQSPFCVGFTLGALPKVCMNNSGEKSSSLFFFPYLGPF